MALAPIDGAGAHPYHGHRQPAWATFFPKHCELGRVMSAPLVTVIALCYNHARFLETCLDSIRHQTYSNCQLIITDDYSTDGSRNLIKAWIARHNIDCLFLPNPRNYGICWTLNKALSRATGTYVAMVATDDLWDVEKIKQQVQVFETLSERVAVLYSDAYQIDENGSALADRFLVAHGIHVPPRGDIFHRLVIRNFIPAMTTMIRRKVLEVVGPYDEQLVFEDWDMWLRIAERQDFAFSDHVTASYRVVSTSLTRTVLRADVSEGYSSHARIRIKTLESPRLSPKERLQLRRDLCRQCESLYRLGNGEARRFLAIAVIRHHHSRALVLLVSSWLGVSYNSFCAIKYFIARASSYLRWRRKRLLHKLIGSNEKKE